MLPAPPTDSFIIVRPVREEKPVPSFQGTIVNVNEDQLVVCFESPLGLAIGERITIGYHDPGTQRFVLADGRINSYLTHDPKPLYELEITSDFRYAERRTSFRVETHGVELSASIGDEKGLPVLNVSEGGCCVICPERQYIGAKIQLTLCFKGQFETGTLIVRHTARLSGHRWKIGFECPPEQKRLHEFLHDLTMSIQRLHLRRRSRIVETDRPLPQKADADEEKGPKHLVPIGRGLAVIFPFEMLVNVPLPGTLRGEDGRILKKRGGTLTTEEVAELQHRTVVADKDWWLEKNSVSSIPVDGENEVQENENEENEEDEEERRRCDRIKWAVDANIRILEDNDSRQLTVRTRNLSQSGICLSSRTYLAVGTHVSISVPINDRMYEMRGTVVSCDYESSLPEPTHRVGVEFSESLLETNALREAG